MRAKADETHFARLAKISLERDKLELLNTRLTATLMAIALWGKRTGAFQDHQEDQQIRRAIDSAIAAAEVKPS